jgi:phosphoglycolate phosphatase-like HAD superfamily hydrolase
LTINRRAPALILFDLDGTLVDTAGAGRRAIERAFDEIFAVPAVTEKTEKIRFAGMTDSAIFNALVEAAGIDGQDYERLNGPLQESYLRHLRAVMQEHEPRRRVMPGIGPLLVELHIRDGVHLGLLTGNLEAGARIKLDPFGLNQYFPGGGFGSDHTDRREVARQAWRKLCDLTGIEFPPSQVTAIGDTERDVDCARANGFRAVAVESGWVDRETLEAARPDALFTDLTDLPAVLAALDLEPS